jgi:hypothetical protein
MEKRNQHIMKAINFAKVKKNFSHASPICVRKASTRAKFLIDKWRDKTLHFSENHSSFISLSPLLSYNRKNNLFIGISMLF